jgi:RNA polymerase sigma-70 factor, ECF subfamily
MSGGTAAKRPEFAPPADEELISRLQGGDEVAFNLLVGRYKNVLMNFAFRFLGDYDEADDVVQETFVRLFRNRDSYRPVAKFSTWLYTICGNLARNQLRKRKQRGPLSLLWPFHGRDDPRRRDIPDESARADAEAERALQRDVIQKALNSLSPEQRQVVILFDIQELSYEEICDVTGLNMGTVKSRLSRARAQLREKLAALRQEWRDR